MEDSLAASKNKIDAILGAAIEVLQGQGLAGNVAIKSVLIDSRYLTEKDIYKA